MLGSISPKDPKIQKNLPRIKELLLNDSIDIFFVDV